MVAPGYHIGPGGKEFFQKGRGEPEAGRGVFAVDRYEIRRIFFNQRRQPEFQNVKPRIAYNIAHQDCP
jgi:hypothetical protein